MAKRSSPVVPRGVTLLESVVALTILLVGLVGLMQLQVYGITSNGGARLHTQAWQAARELAAALERLQPDDPLLAPHYDGEAVPADFGHLLLPSGNVVSSGFRAWDDSIALPGVTKDAASTRDPIDPAQPAFVRRWQVWQFTTAAATAGVKTIAVSVVYRERHVPFPREVVVLTQVSNRGLAAAYAAAYR